MKKFGLFIIGGIAGIVLLANLGSMIGLAVSLLLLYLVFKQFLKSTSTFAKVVWVIVGLAILSTAAANIPAILGVVALYVLYLVFKKWNKHESKAIVENSNDPFVNFEKQWAELK